MTQSLQVGDFQWKTNKEIFQLTVQNHPVGDEYVTLLKLINNIQKNYIVDAKRFYNIGMIGCSNRLDARV